MKLVAAVLLTVFTSSPALALTIQGTPAQEAVIEHTWEKLSPCVQDHIVHAHLEKVIVKPAGRLGTDRNFTVEPEQCKVDDRDRDRTVYNVQAVSLFPGHKIYIDAKFDVPSVIMHEFGHWFANDVIRKEYDAAWRQAVALDFAEMDKCDAFDNDYLKNPYEAAAQIFAAQTLGKAYSAKFYDVSGFRHSNALMAEILVKTCS